MLADVRFGSLGDMAPVIRCPLYPRKRTSERLGRDVRFVPQAAVDRLYSITSSARTSSDGGTERPSALAVLRFSLVSYFVGA